MKKLHLICNAHIDPLWLWNWQDGVAAGVSTFAAAEELSRRFDYVFCHNESLLYEAVKEYAPDLFGKIKELVRRGKWHVAGGWYLQPDCNLPEGETINRCLHRGLDFFEREFGVRPQTAINYDSFGHSRGLVQILAGNGYQNYLICRPGKDEWTPEREIFEWEGCDHSVINVFRAGAHYSSERGKAAQKIKEALSSKEEVFALLWGVGNHGGGPSAKDLADIENLMRSSRTEIVHSTPDAFFGEVDAKGMRCTVPVQGCMPGCYSSMSTVKKKFRQTESAYYSTEILCATAAANGVTEYPQAELDSAMESILKCSFHDILPGSCVQAGEQFAQNMLGGAYAALEQIRMRAVYALMKGERRAEEGEYPVFVFNPEPVAVKTVLSCEFTLADQNREREWLLPEADMNGKRVPVQLLREASNLPIDWSKKVLLECELAPMQLNRISVRFHKGLRPVCKEKISMPFFRHEAQDRVAVLDRATGLLSSLSFGGERYLGEGAFRPVLYPDVPDPWMMEEKYANGFVGEKTEIPLLSAEEVPAFVGAGERGEPVYLLERGEVCARAESLFGYGATKVRIDYTFYENNSYIDVNVGVLWNERNKVLKLELPIGACEPCAQAMLGREGLTAGGAENVIQKWVGFEKNGKVFAVLNDGIYACSFAHGVLSLTLLRGTTYTSYPLENLPMLRAEGYVPSMDLGWHEYNFRVGLFDEHEVDAAAQRFNRRPVAMNLFPLSGTVGKKSPLPIQIEGQGISLLCMKRAGEATLLRLYHPSHTATNATVRVGEATCNLRFEEFSVRTLRYDGKTLSLCNDWEV